MSLLTVGPTSDFFVMPPTDDPDAVLRPVTFDHADGAMVHGVMGEDTHLDEGAQLTAYFNHRGEFFKQPAVVQTVTDDGGVIMEFLGDPVSANQRQSFRVSCIGCDITATLGDEVGCQVVDISATGFGLYARQSLRIGDILDTVVSYAGQEHHGQVAIQSIRRLPGCVRYGVCAVDCPAGRALVKALPKVNLAVQREQMRRLA